MASVTLYKLIHVLGVVLVFAGFGGLLVWSGGGQSGGGRKPAVIAHGLGLLVLLITGFGMLARLGLGGSWPLWVWGKLVVWLLFGGAIVLIRRAPRLAGLLWVVLPLLGLLATYFAIYKPVG